MSPQSDRVAFFLFVLAQGGKDAAEIGVWIAAYDLKRQREAPHVG